MYCAINGQHCDALGSVGWVFTTGVEPHVQAFEMDAAEAGRLIDGGGEVTLTIQDQKLLTVERLSVIGEAPSSRDKFRTVLVADLRWKWKRKLVTGRYNCRRTTGTKTLIAPNFVQLGQVVDDFEFMPASLNHDSQKWKPGEVMEDIFKKLAAGEDFDFDFVIATDTDSLEVNDVDIRENGPDAVSIALSHLPGSMLWVDRQGIVRVESAIGLKEAEVIGALGPDIKDEGHVRRVSYQWTRPSKINVYFVRQQAVRHDSADSGSTYAVDDRVMTNVGRVTDPFVTLSQGQQGAGSWAPFTALIPYWNTDLPSTDGVNPVPPPISETIIQQCFFQDALFRVYVPFGGEVPQPIWSGRINTIKADYRQTYQINRRWVDRSFQILAIRPEIVDVTTGTRGRSQAYGDYCVKSAALPRALAKHKGKLWHNVYGGARATGAAGGGTTPFSAATPLADAQVTPAVVTMIDEQAGIVHLDFLVDPYGTEKEIYPSSVQNVPSAVMNDTQSKGANMRIGEGGTVPQLAASDHKAVVLTHVPAMPNSNAQFYKISVSPSDVTGLVPGLAIEPSKGPEWDVFIEPGVTTAMMGWLDSAAATIERSFGVGNNPPGDQPPKDADNAVLQTLLVNEETLKVVAFAKAAEIWSKLTDRMIGSKAVRMDPGVKIKGSIESVAHEVRPDGAVITRVTLPEELASRNYLALLPEGTRRIVFREVIP